jgi:hypothetical protein
MLPAVQVYADGGECVTGGVTMAVNIVAVVLLAACVVLAVRAIVNNYKNAKAAGNPGCIGCSACCGKNNGCCGVKYRNVRK